MGARTEPEATVVWGLGKKDTEVVFPTAAEPPGEREAELCPHTKRLWELAMMDCVFGSLNNQTHQE